MNADLLLHIWPGVVAALVLMVAGLVYVQWQRRVRTNALPPPSTPGTFGAYALFAFAGLYSASLWLPNDPWFSAFLHAFFAWTIWVQYHLLYRRTTFEHSPTGSIVTDASTANGTPSA